MDPRYDGDADREEFEALIALGDDGVDVTEAIGDIHDRRAARDADFQSLVGPLMESAGIQVVWRASDDDEARSERLAGARRWQFLGKDPITGAVRLHHPEGFTELHYPDGTVDHIEDGFSPGWSRRPAREASAGPAVARGTGTGAVIRSRSNLSAMSETGRQRHRTYVGGGDYDLKGAMQLTLLYSLGLRAEHRLLDIGCGSLRAGRFIIPYLNAGGYTGLEPNTWLIDEAIEKEIGRDVLDIKKPIFVNNDQFDVSGVGEFDFVLAHSIASHTGPALTKILLKAVREALSPTGIAAVTFIHTEGPDNKIEGWIYPEKGLSSEGAVRYKRKTIDGWLRGSGLKGTPIGWYHPRRQTWWLIARQEGSLPPKGFRVQETGVTLAYRDSWDPSLQIRRLGGRAKRRVVSSLSKKH